VKVQGCADAGTLCIAFRDRHIAGTKDPGENAVLGLDAGSNVCAIPFEHASKRTDMRRLNVEGIAA
jgi:uncharacterized protein YuzE